MIATPNDKVRPEYCLDAFQRIALWTVGYAVDSGPNAGANGPILPKCEIDALGVPFPAILRRLAGGPDAANLSEREVNYWGKTIRRAAFSDGWERPVHAVPGEPVPPGVPHHIEITPDLGCMPFSDINAAIERLAISHGVPADELCFKHRGVRIADADMLFRMVRIKPGDAGALADALANWRDQASARLAQARADAGEEYTIPLPAWLRNARLPRPELAKLIGRTLQTLYRWDQQGYGPYGFEWHKGRRVSGNLVLVDMEANWPTIEGLMMRELRKTADWRERIKQSVEHFMYGENPVLEEIIKNEERARKETQCQAS